ncbi:membrane protein insertase YidC [Mycoplasma sp. P36-A1]|uniref:membrane protein insertase YidC n=1 Tax=Mycoplasma sp. P36-A1 TaxID=3252900 RepID=UPI003C2FF7AE
MKYLKNILVVFLVAMLLTSCAGSQQYTIPVDAQLTGGFQYGIFQGFIVYPIGILINKLTILLGSAGLAMIITTIIVRTITLPVTMKAQMATKGMSELQPKMAAIEEKYRGREDEHSKQRKAQDMQKLYSDMDVNPLTSMMYPFLSMPIFMGVWRATNQTEAITTGTNTFLGYILGATPAEQIGQGNYTYIIIMLLVGITQFVQFKLSNHLTSQRNKSKKSYKTNPKADAMQKQMGMMTYIFTAMMVFMSYTLATAMSFYLIISAVISIFQAFYIDKKMKED